MYFALSARALLQVEIKQVQPRNDMNKLEGQIPGDIQLTIKIKVSFSFHHFMPTIFHPSQSKHLHKNLKDNWHSIQLRAHTLLAIENCRYTLED